MTTYTVHYTEHYQITIDADDAEEAENIATGTPLGQWTHAGEVMHTEEAEQ